MRGAHQQLGSAKTRMELQRSEYSDFKKSFADRCKSAAHLERRVLPIRRQVARQLAAHDVLGRPGTRGERPVDHRCRRQLGYGWRSGSCIRTVLVTGSWLPSVLDMVTGQARVQIDVQRIPSYYVKSSTEMSSRLVKCASRRC